MVFNRNYEAYIFWIISEVLVFVVLVQYFLRNLPLVKFVITMENICKLRRALDALSRSEFSKFLLVQDSTMLIDILCDSLSQGDYDKLVNSMIEDADSLICSKNVQSYKIGDENVKIMLKSDGVVCSVEECNTRGIKRKYNGEIVMGIQGRVEWEKKLNVNNGSNRCKNVKDDCKIKELVSLEPLKKKHKVLE